MKLERFESSALTPRRGDIGSNRIHQLLCLPLAPTNPCAWIDTDLRSEPGPRGLLAFSAHFWSWFTNGQEKTPAEMEVGQCAPIAHR